MFWFFLWFLLAVFLIGITVWSQSILLRQKQAWEKFARKHKLVFRKGTFMGAAEVSGRIGPYEVSFYTAERQVADVRGKRYVSVVELDLTEPVIDGGVAGTKEMLPFMQTLDVLHHFPVTKEGWDPEHQIFVKHDAVAHGYFTPERLGVFESVLKTKNADTIVVFSDTQLVLRMETSDPMQDAEKIDKIVMRQIALADKMRLTPDQRKDIMALAKNAEPDPTAVPTE